MKEFKCEDCGCEFKAEVTKQAPEPEPHLVVCLGPDHGSLVLHCPHCGGTMVKEVKSA